MSHISASDMQELRATLEGERTELMQELAERGKRDPETGNWQGASSSEGEEADPNDVADNIEELATNIPIVEELEKRLADVEAALAKMDAGTYGMCENDGSPIPLERLRANPSARTNI